MYPHYLFLFKSIVGHIKKNLLFKNQTQAFVDQWLAELREETSSEKEMIFIGVHCRRTDYGAHMEVCSIRSFSVDRFIISRA